MVQDLGCNDMFFKVKVQFNCIKLIVKHELSKINLTLVVYGSVMTFQIFPSE